MTNRAKLRYKVDLQRYMADCDSNYLRLLKLFPQVAQMASSRRFSLGCDNRVVVEMQVHEQTAYTTLLSLSQADDAGDSLDHWCQLPQLQLRLYHDARVVEVVACQGIWRLRPRYGYPNKRMLQQDEKAQWNRFLTEWLSHCLEHGYSFDPMQFNTAKGD